MTTYNDVFTSILAMDSYHRNYNQGVFLDSPGAASDDDPEGNNQIGNVKIIDRYVDKSKSFYAVAYEYTAAVDGHQIGDIVISYRGTDQISLAANADIWVGWVSGGGITAGSEVDLAIKFYEDVLHKVTGNNTLTAFDTAPSNFTLTGHSLGGGLAAIVASLSHANAYGVDNMPFFVSTMMVYFGEILFRAVSSDNVASLLGITNLSGEDRINYMAAHAELLPAETMAQIINYLAIEQKMPQAPDWSKFSSIHIEGEVLQYLREGIIPGAVALVGALTGIPELATIGAAYLAGFAIPQSNVVDEELSTYMWENSDPIKRHSNALEVILLDAKYKGTQDWLHNSYSATGIIEATFNSKIAGAIGLSEQPHNNDGSAPPADKINYTGFTSGGEQMQRMIAYSAIEQGTKPFGDVAIKAFLSDANDLAHSMYFSFSVDEISNALSQILVQFSGTLAFAQKVTSSSDGFSEGVLSLSNDNKFLFVNLTDSPWASASKLGVAPEKIIGADTFISSVLGDASSFGSVWREAMYSAWATEDTKIFKFFTINLGIDPINLHLPEPNVLPSGKE
ncbi:MAG: hypothetical protein J0L55_15675, partial [Caulobacterales bacterium]|nr:hypothetical protein [Caulobacterales bacterium]